MREPKWLSLEIITALHTDQVREHGGALGVRDAGLMESAIERPRRSWEYDGAVDLAALAADYGFGLAKNHPFADGNKRIAFVATNVFLIINGYEIEAEEPEVVSTVLKLADGRLSRNKFAEWIRAHLVKYASE